MTEWDLHAITSRSNQLHDEDNHHHHHHHQQHLHHDQEDCFESFDMKKEYDQAYLFCFPHLFDQATTSSTMDQETIVTDELDQFYKPFYNPLPPPPAAAADGDNNNNIQINIHHHNYHDSDQEIQQHHEQDVKNFNGSVSNTSQLAPKLKKRKNQQKRVVAQVTAAGLSSDPWAWRKYGQKPIKGSIYPRSYYRCSSSKNCMARRQVEQSCTDSNIYILTYTGDHNHPQPTRRNSLAGINRNRIKSTPKSPISSDVGKTVTKSKTSPLYSPITISTSSSIEDEVIQQPNIKQETMFHNNSCDMNQGHVTVMPGINDEDYMVFSDDFFEGLEDLGGYKMEPSSSYYSSTKQYPHVFC